MKVTYCMPFLNNAEIGKSVKAVLESKLQPQSIVVMDNSGQNLAYTYLRDYVHTGKVFIIPQTKNQGVARSWNYFMSMYDDYVIIANDDVQPHKHTIREIVHAAESNYDEIFFCGSGTSGNAFSFFLLRKDGWLEVGHFDHTSFNRGYFEDNDYILRVRQAGYTQNVVDKATYDHDVSATYKHLKSDQEKELHHMSFRAHQLKYMQKWGGIPLEETYTTPFNSGIAMKEWHKRNVKL